MTWTYVRRKLKLFPRAAKRAKFGSRACFTDLQHSSEWVTEQGLTSPSTHHTGKSLQSITCTTELYVGTTCTGEDNQTAITLQRKTTGKAKKKHWNEPRTKQRRGKERERERERTRFSRLLRYPVSKMRLFDYRSRTARTCTHRYKRFCASERLTSSLLCSQYAGADYPRSAA